MAKYRIDGPTLGVENLYVDAEVNDVTIDGDVELKEIDGGRTFETTIDEWRTFREKNRVVEHANLANANHTAWADLESVRAAVSSGMTEQVATSVRSDLQSVFRTLLNADRENTPETT